MVLDYGWTIWSAEIKKKFKILNYLDGRFIKLLELRVDSFELLNIHLFYFLNLFIPKIYYGCSDARTVDQTTWIANIRMFFLK